MRGPLECNGTRGQTVYAGGSAEGCVLPNSEHDVRYGRYSCVSGDRLRLTVDETC